MLILHIGTHKTGTSALQSYLMHNADVLDAAGVHYLKAGLSDGKAHHELSWSLRGMFDAKLSVWDDLRNELATSKSRINVISSEAMWFTDPEAVRAELRSVDDVQIVVYLRRQDKYLQSLYKQTVKGGRRMAFEQWREKFGFRGDYLKVVEQWASQFGSKSICLRPYERDGKTIDVIDDFVARLDVGELSDTRQRSRRHNPSPRSELLQLIRAFNQLNLEVDRDRFVFSIMKKNPEYVRSGDLLTYEQCSKLMAGYESDNKTLTSRFYRETEPLFPDLIPFEPPDVWQHDQDEYFQLTVDFLETLTEIASEGGLQPKKRKKKAGDDLLDETGRVLHEDSDVRA